MDYSRRWPRSRNRKPARTQLVYPADPVEFAVTHLGVQPDSVQSEILRSESHRLMLCMGRRCGKSFAVSIRALHFALTHPGTETLVFSRSARQANILLANIAGFLRSLGIRRRGDGFNAHSILLPNGSRILALPPVIDTVLGFTPHLLVLDEAARIPDELYKGIRPMLALNDPTMILLSTPLGRRGFFYEEWVSSNRPWQRFHSVATDNPRISAEFLAEERATAPDHFFRQEYLCEFIDQEGAFFPDALLERALDRTLEPFSRGFTNINAFPPQTTLRSIFVALDLGQSVDPSAYCVLEYIKFYSPDFDPVFRTFPEITQVRVRHMGKYPLGTPYHEVVSRTSDLVSALSTATGVRRTELIIDASAMGAPVVEMFRAAKPKCSLMVPVVITSGQTESQSGDTHRVPKRDLINRLRLALENGRLRIPSTLPSLDELRTEYRNFQSATYSAAPGHHDDLLIALALAVWRTL